MEPALIMMMMMLITNSHAILYSIYLCYVQKNIKWAKKFRTVIWFKPEKANNKIWNRTAFINYLKQHILYISQIKMSGIHRPKYGNSDGATFILHTKGIYKNKIKITLQIRYYSMLCLIYIFRYFKIIISINTWQYLNLLAPSAVFATAVLINNNKYK